jgi:UDP-N-acetylmuramoyl-tripeptide--D-alanyl-D-alanine ligase
MKAAVQVLAAEPGRRVAVLGDMGELGAQAGPLHAEVGRAAREAGLDALLAFGEMGRDMAQAFGPGARHFTSVEALVEAARAESAAGATLLVKGSRFMRMERVTDALAGPGGSHAA